MIYEDLSEFLGKAKTKQQLEARVSVSSLDQYQRLFVGGLTTQTKAELAKHIPRFSADAPQNYNLDFLQEVVGHVYAGTPLKSAEAQAFTRQAFPVDVTVLTGGNVTISTDMTIGPGAAPYLINADTLTIDGGSLTVIATALTIKANKLIITQSQKSQKPYHIGIFGQTGESGTPGQDGRPYTNPAQAGSHASAPSPGICTGASNGGGGSAGSKGAAGEAGQNGKDGLANLPANISIAALDGGSAEVIISTQSGAGGDGGNGGTGGVGQTGGVGGQGCNSGCEGTDGGSGGNGGDGGPGGNGGNGGSGADGNPIVISFPAASKDQLRVISVTAKGGYGGQTGLGGKGGAGGGGGGGGIHKSNGKAGGEGNFGADGKAGLAGQHDGAPGNVTYHFT